MLKLMFFPPARWMERSARDLSQGVTSHSPTTVHSLSSGHDPASTSRHAWKRHGEQPARRVLWWVTLPTRQLFFWSHYLVEMNWRKLAFVAAIKEELSFSIPMPLAKPFCIFRDCPFVFMAEEHLLTVAQSRAFSTEWDKWDRKPCMWNNVYRYV